MNYEAGIAVLQLPLYYCSKYINCRYRELGLSKVLLQVAVCALASPFSLYAMGLGDMRVHSGLNQPFHAQITLKDIGNHLLENIRVELASAEEYERVGFDRGFAVSLLQFRIIKNARGRPVIEVTSKERLTEPYLDILVDLSWSTGQIFKQYIVLLDPPDYTLKAAGFCRVKASYSSYIYKPSLTLAKADAPVIQTVYAAATAPPAESMKPLTYGPVSTEETVWQIAQHYKIPELKLGQIVLAIVGMNPKAFSDGNLNGLKTGAKLVIPPANLVLKVPANLTSEEIAAHDLAWKEKQAINHVISPPYFNEDLASEIMPIGLLKAEPSSEPAGSFDRLSSEIQNIAKAANISDNNPAWVPVEKTESPANAAPDANNQTLAALQALQASNALLNNHLSALQNQNKQLQEQLNKRDQEFAEIREQLKQLTLQRQAAGAQVHSQDKPESSSSWLFWLSALLLLGAGAYAAWRNQVELREYYERLLEKFSNPNKKQFFHDVVSNEATAKAEPVQQEVEKVIPLAPETLEAPKPAEPTGEPQPEPEPQSKVEEPPAPVQEQSAIDPGPEAVSEKEAEPENLSVEENPEFISEKEEIPEIEQDNNLLEFEPGLYSSPEKKAMEPDQNKDLPEEPHEDAGDESGLLKNNEALDTLLDLAKTYISMGDSEAARQSLDEIMAFGSPEQKKEAEALLKSIP